MLFHFKELSHKNSRAYYLYRCITESSPNFKFHKTFITNFNTILHSHLFNFLHRISFRRYYEDLLQYNFKLIIHFKVSFDIEAIAKSFFIHYFDSLCFQKFIHQKQFPNNHNFLPWTLFDPYISPLILTYSFIQSMH